MPTVSPERKTTVTGTTIELVAHPVGIQMYWNPETQQGDIRFEFLEYLSIDGVAVNKDFGRHGVVSRKFSQIKTVKPGYAGLVDPNTGQALDNISFEGVMHLLLDGFDKGYVQDAAPPP